MKFELPLKPIENNPSDIRNRYQLLCQLETKFEALFQEEIIRLQNLCQHQAICSSETLGYVSVDCEYCGKTLLDPLAQESA